MGLVDGEGTGVEGYGVVVGVEATASWCARGDGVTAGTGRGNGAITGQRN